MGAGAGRGRRRRRPEGGMRAGLARPGLAPSSLCHCPLLLHCCAACRYTSAMACFAAPKPVRFCPGKVPGIMLCLPQPPAAPPAPSSTPPPQLEAWDATSTRLLHIEPPRPPPSAPNLALPLVQMQPPRRWGSAWLSPACAAAGAAACGLRQSTATAHAAASHSPPCLPTPTSCEHPGRAALCLLPPHCPLPLKNTCGH